MGSGYRSWRCSGDVYQEMSDAGMFDGKRVQLLEGEIIEMSPQNDPHVWGWSQLGAVAYRYYGDITKFSIFPGGTFWASDDSAPEPDYFVCECPLGVPVGQRPMPLWVAEVSDSTYRLDRTRKARIYAAAGVTDYWIINVNARRLELYRDPAEVDGEWTYRDITHLGSGETFSPLNGPKHIIPVDDLLPPVPGQAEPSGD